MPLSGFVKDVMPGSLHFLLLGLAIGVVLIFGNGRAAAWGRRWLTLMILLYGMLSLQGTSDLLIDGLWSGAPIRSAADTRGARLIVVLGNGAYRLQRDGRGVDVLNAQTAYNVLEAARLHAMLDGARVLTSGGPSSNGIGSESQAMADALVAAGVPREDIELEPASRTTLMQGREVARLLRQRGETSFVLVTTPEHMRRAREVFRSLGLDPVPAPSAIRYGGEPFWRPTRFALDGSRHAIYEYVALAWYRGRGWL